MAYGNDYNQYAGAAKAAAAKAGIPENILDAVIDKESSWNVAVPTGKAGDTGLGQLTPGIYTDKTLTDNFTLSAFNPTQNLQISANLLAQNYKATGNWTDALSRYNTGKDASKSSIGAAYAKDVLGRSGGATDTTATGTSPDSVLSSVMDKLNGILNYQLIPASSMGPSGLSSIFAIPATQLIIVLAGGAVILFGLWQLVQAPLSSASGAASKIALAAS